MTGSIDFSCFLLTLFYYLLESLCTLPLSELCAFSVHSVPVRFLPPCPYWIFCLCVLNLSSFYDISLWRSLDFTPGIAFFFPLSFFVSWLALPKKNLLYLWCLSPSSQWCWQKVWDQLFIFIFNCDLNSQLIRPCGGEQRNKGMWWVGGERRES